MKHFKLFFALFAMLALGVGNAWAEGNYVKVTTAPSDWSGDYLIVYEDGNVAFDGSLTTLDVASNKITVSINDGKIASTSEIDKAKFTIAKSDANYTIKSASGYYIGHTADANKLSSSTSTQYANSISLNQDGSAHIVASGKPVLRYNAASGNYRFRYFKSSTYTSQKAIHLYKYIEEQSGGETPDPTPVTVTLNKTELNLQAGATETLTATITGSTEAVTWSSSATGVASVDNTGKVTAVAAGNAIITAAIGDVKATCAVTVTAATTPEEPGTGGEETWTLVTNASDLKAGDQIVIAATESDYALGTTQNTNNRVAVSVTKGTNTITIGDDVQIITLETGKVANTFAFNTGSGYLYAASSSANNLKTKADLDNNGSWAISITSAGVATIQAKGTNTRNLLKKNSSSALFSCYGSGQSDVAIYKKVTSSGGDEPSTPTPSVTLDPSVKDFGTINVGENPSQEFTITTENTTATLTASIDNTTDYAVSAIAGNKVTVTYQPQSAGTHPAVLTVKAGEEATATVNLTGKAVQALEGTWILVTDASSLKAGDEIIIASKDENYALSRTQNGNNRGQVEITKTDNTITATTEAQVLTLQAGTQDGTLALSTGDGYLFAASSGSNWLRTETTLSDNSSWKVTIAADGTATLIAQGTNTKNTLYYNKSSKIFSCYSTAQQPIAIYKNTNGQQLAGLAYATTKYLTKLGDAFAAPALTNPNSLAVTYSSSDNNVATVAADGAVTIKAAGVVKITASFEETESYLGGSASYTIGVTEHAGTQADPYSVADARRVIDVMETATDVYATGVVSEIVTAYNASHGNITYNISVDGTTTADQLQAYNGKSYNGANFTSADDIKVGDEVVVKGNLKKYNTTYEFDKENQLVSLNRTKEQAGLAYAETEHTANVGEDFAEPALTNPNSLTVTYSSSNTTLATVNATTGEVTILAAGKVTITASTTGNASYAAGSASYNITITDPSLAVATLPFYFDGKRDDIEGTAGMTHEGIDSDYSAKPYLKFNTAGDWAIVQFDSEPGEFSFLLKQNGSNAGIFNVYESVNGEDYTSVWSGGDLGGNVESATIEPTLSSTARYVKFEYTTKGASTNYGLGEISIKKADHRQEAGLAWNPATVSLTVGDAFTAPTFSNPNSLAGITFTSDNEALATVDNAGVISLVSGKTGTATITATFADGHATYKPAEATCVITVSPKSEKVVILAEYNGQWYALKAAYLSGKTDRLDAVPVNYVGGKLYNVAETDKEAIEWNSIVEGTKVSFLHDGKYLKGKTSTTLLFEAGEDGLYQWDNTNYTMTIGTTVRSFLYNGEAFRNFAVSNAGKVVNDVLYSSLPVVTAPVYATGDAYGRTVTTGEYGTICIPYGSSNYTGAEFYEISWMEMDGTTPKGIWLDQVNGALTAGKPYIFKATADEIAIVGDGTTAAAPVVGVAGLTGTFRLIQDSETSGDALNKLEGNYMIAGNQFLLCGTGCWLKENRAYIDASIIAGHTTKKEEIPGRRRVCLGETSENTTTGVDNNQLPNANIQKIIENGQFIIIRDGVKYNVQGVRL